MSSKSDTPSSKNPPGGNFTLDTRSLQLPTGSKPDQPTPPAPAAPKPLSEPAKADLRTFIESYTSGPTPKLPGALVHIIDTSSNELFSYGTHNSSIGRALSPTETVAVTFSVSKVIGAIAFLQLVDRGLVQLDDPRVIADKLPELARKKVHVGTKENEDGTKEWMFEDRKTDITPRMLMSHSWGGGHSLFHSALADWMGRPERGVSHMECNETNDWYSTILDVPLLYQPGTKALYSHGPNWISVLHERITGRRLDEYMQEEMFGKMELKKIGFEGQYMGEVAARKEGEKEGPYWPNTFLRDGKFVPFSGTNETWMEKIERPDAFPVGKHHWIPTDSGIVAAVADVARLLSILALPNAGLDPVTGNRILSAEAVKQITSPQLPEGIKNTGRHIISETVPDALYPVDLEAEHNDPGGCFGLCGNVQKKDRILKSGKKGRSKGTFSWYGAANTEYWVDSEKGIIAVLNGNCRPWNLDVWLGLRDGVEERIYAALEKA
ncbi:unnamed protein product [Periconia digitata]|uniref:Beta-lactamase-related domain-containing protein n=1 Tax=Periconia digitata TaxID=1303443 RepID=A0A9W4U516_9PLEO|nr:unnamed protein product [Periconia digitata]